MSNEIVKYEPRHVIRFWDDSTTTIKSVHVPALKKAMNDPNVTMIDIGRDSYHKNFIKSVTEATQSVSELEMAISGESLEVKRKVREEVAKREASRLKITPAIIRNMIEHFRNQA